MSKMIELPDEVYGILEQTAANSGLAPVQWIARYLAAFGDEPGPDPATGATRTVAGLLKAHLGPGSSPVRHREVITDDPAKKDCVAHPSAADCGTPKPRNMAERLAGRLGTFSGSAGQPSIDNVAHPFAEHLEAKQRVGTI